MISMLYKYLKKQYADLLIKRGKIRIGTLFEYRDIEKYRNIVGDKDEGEKSLYLEVGSEIWTVNNQPDFTKELLKIDGGVTLQIENGLTIQKTKSSINYYMYCTSEVFNKEALKDLGYDSCIVIENQDRFFAAITRTLRYKAKFEGVFRCQYLPRRVEYNRDHNIHPAILKDPKYKDQKEVRALWKPIKSNISPLVIDCRDAAKYCRML